MNRIYFDNAATTPLAPQVIESISDTLTKVYGNPSSTHAAGREAKALLESARKSVAKAFNAQPSEIIFTSGGTEADNTAIKGIVSANDVQRIITSTIEHHAVLHTVEELEKTGTVKVDYVQLHHDGQINMEHLQELLQEETSTLVTLMHANNEIGNLTDIEKVGDLCAEYGAFFHSDTVQTLGHLPIDTQKIKVHALAGSAHKFHGPKGAGILYLRKGTRMHSLIAGGGQERELRSGTESIHNIVGMTKALELATDNMKANQAKVEGLKKLMIEKLQEAIPGITFNGRSAQIGESLYTVLNMSLPPSPKNDMLLFTLDLNGISVSGGSACSSGAQLGSHVLTALGTPPERGNARFSFSHYNTEEEVLMAVEKMIETLQ